MANCNGTLLGAPCPGPATGCPIHSARVVQLCMYCADDNPSNAVKGHHVDLPCSRCWIDSDVVPVAHYFLPALQLA